MGKLSYGPRLLRDLAGLAARHKAWWIVPLVVVLLALVAVVATSQAAAPFIYTLF